MMDARIAIATKRVYLVKMRDFWESLTLAFLLAVFIRVFFFSVYKIPTSSMAPTLWPGDFILTSKISYGLQLPFLPYKIGSKYPKQGDLVVFQWSDKTNIPYVKRVIGIAGDHILIKNNKIIVNDTELQLTEIENKWSEFPGMQFMKFYEEEDARGKHTIMHTKEAAETKEFGPFVVPPGEVFVLGDNREGSDDSRYWGSIPLKLIEGRVLFVWLSLDSTGKWAGKYWPRIRTDRIFHWLQ
jgi:signal peptidase I